MRNILRFDELDSTVTYAKQHSHSLADKTIIIAKRQTAGRGRFDRKWDSQEGGLYLGIWLQPRKTDFLANLTQLTALSVCLVLRKLGADAWLKWPNDVLADGKKICGILSEAVASSSGFEGLVIGPGINVRQTDLSHVGQPAVSLKMLGIETDEETVMQHLLDTFFERYEAVAENGFPVIRDEYLKHFPYIGKEVHIQNGVRPVSGAVQTISPEGRLVLQTPQGVTEISIGDMMV